MLSLKVVAAGEADALATVGPAPHSMGLQLWVPVNSAVAKQEILKWFLPMAVASKV
jgi:hypothetical protein